MKAKAVDIARASLADVVAHIDHVRRIAGIGAADMGDRAREDIQTEQSVTVSGYGAMTVNNDPPRVPEGFQHVDDVRMENGRIVIEDRRAQRQVTLAASRGL